MQILSVNIRSQAETIEWMDKRVRTGINKVPVKGPVAITHQGLAGDTIVDKKHHGGVYKAVYSYAIEDYAFWRKALGRPEIPIGAFGENLTTEGLDESTVHIGDRFQVGGAVLQASEPRQPCRVLGMNFQDMTLVKRFLQEARFGVYFQVIEPGTVQAGDPIRRVHADPAAVPIGEISRLHTRDKLDVAGLERVLAVDALPPEWQAVFVSQLKKARAEAR